MRWDAEVSRVAEFAGKNNVHLLRNVEKYLKASNVAPTRFGRDVVGDPRFVFDLRNGREPRPKTTARVLTYLETVQ